MVEKSFIVRTNIRQSSELSVSEEFLEALDKEVEKLLRKAEERSKANSRRTILARDL
jgi:histone H3/H4